MKNVGERIVKPKTIESMYNTGYAGREQKYGSDAGKLSSVPESAGAARSVAGKHSRTFKLISFFSLVLCLQISVFANEPAKSMNEKNAAFIVPINISGQLLNAATNEPISGASVAVKNTKQGTTTASDGAFSLSDVAETATLVISSVGFNPVEVPVSQLTRLSSGGSVSVGGNTIVKSASGGFVFQLKPNAASLEEVVVVAFGQVKKKDLTGSVSTLSGKTISQQHVSTLSRALEGTVSGVQLSTSSGQPGSEAAIRIRGLGSLSAGSEPLVVVDGVPSAFPLSSYNPADIESVVVSKDAASNSLYGSRASNGVILVTTKRGARGKAQINFDVRLGQNSQGVPDFDMIKDPAEFYEATWKGIYNYVRYSNDATAPHLNDADARQFASNNLFTAVGASIASNNLGNYMLYKIPAGTTLIDPATGKIRPDAQKLYHDDWTDYFIKKSFTQQYNISLSGGNEKTDYFLSAGYMSDPSYVMASDFNRYNARLKVNTAITNWLKGGMNLSYARRYSNAPNYSGGTVNTNVFAFKDFFAPIYALYAHNEDGSIRKHPNGEVMYDLGTGETWSPYGPTRRAAFNGYSPAIYFEKDLNESTVDDFSGRAFLEASVLKDFRVKLDFSLDNVYTLNKTYGNNESGIDARDRQGSIRQIWAKGMTLNAIQTVNWLKSYGAHSIDLLAGHEYRWTRYDNMDGLKSLMFKPDDPDMTNAIRINHLNGNGYSTALEGYLSRLAYNYDSKYYVTGSIRTDGSSNFRYNKWGTFWSLGGAWRISQERFMESTSKWINELKLRSSYGTLGNQNVGINRWTDIWAISNASGLLDAPSLGIGQSTIGNPGLSWESNNIFDAGLDFRLWDRFYGSVDYFRRKTIDMLWAKPLPASTGQPSRLENVASLMNTGFEVELGIEIIRNKDLNWTASLRASHYRNKLLEIPVGVGSKLLNGNYEEGNYLRGEGKDYYNLYLYKYAGVDKATGEGMIYKELKASDNLALYPGKKVGDIVTTKGNDGTKFEMGTASPDLIGGFNTQIQYKNFDLSIMTSWQLGGKAISLTYQNLMSQRIGGLHKDLAYGWSPENTNSNIPMYMANPTGLTYFSKPVGGAQGQYSDFAMFDASYFNIRNVMVGYRLPDAIAMKNGIEALRLFFSVDNLHIFTAKKGLDPRQSFDGGSTLAAFGFPQTRTITFGINLTL